MKLTAEKGTQPLGAAAVFAAAAPTITNLFWRNTLDLDSMTIGDFKKLAGMFGGGGGHLSNPGGAINVVVLQRGFVYVGRVHVVGSEVRIKDASCIRNWGTTKGLGQLVLNGPTDKTVLDPIGEVVVHELAVVSLSPCNQEAWKCKLTGF